MLRLVGLAVLLGVIGAGLLDDAAGFVMGALGGVVLHTVLSLRGQLRALRSELERQRATISGQQQTLSEMARDLRNQKVELAAVAAAGMPQRPPGVDERPNFSQPAPEGLLPDLAVLAQADGPAPTGSQGPVAESGAVAPFSTMEPSAGPDSLELSVPAAVDPAMGQARSEPAAAVAQTAAADPDGWPAAPDPFAVARELLFGGNTVVRVGVLVLLIGLALLVKYAADNSLLPIEWRLSLTALSAIGLTGFGYSQRDKRKGFSHALQGGGVAALYLVIFFAFRVYDLLPGGLAFAFLVATAGLGTLLAVLQNAMSLAVIAQIGGFAAPVLASSGGGSHVALFSYYLVLNLAICGVALVRAWRPLNVIGFVSTFGIGAAWGALSYEPEHFASTEPFLIAFFLMYVAIPVLYALRHGRAKHAYVDGSLLFGVPLATLLMQGELVGDRPFAMAFTTIGMAALYLGLAIWLRKRATEAFETLVETLLALGVGFATLAVPYGLSNHNLTGATWALEGAGLYFVGVRQGRTLSRVAGIALQFLAGLALIVGLLDHPVQAGMPVFNTRMLGASLVALGSLFIARWAYAHRDSLLDWEGLTLQGFIPIALFFLGGFLHDDLSATLPIEYQAGTFVALVGLSGIALEWVAARYDWMPGRVPAALLLPALPWVIGYFDSALQSHPFGHFGYVGVPVYVAAGLVSLVRFAPGAGLVGRIQQPFAFWSLSLLVGAELAALSRYLELGTGFEGAGRLFGPVSGAFVLYALRAKERFPCGPAFDKESRVAVAGLGALILLQGVADSIARAGGAEPLPFIPVFNPLELTLLLGLLSLLRFALLRPEHFLPSSVQHESGLLRAGLAAYAFLLLNTMLARAVHHLAHVPYDADRLFEASAMQMTLSIAWSVLALSVMWLAHRKALRMPWLAAASLLAVVVLKLFLVDLSQLGAVAKIATFLVVGVLFVLIGFVAPVPPSADAKGEAV